MFFIGCAFGLFIWWLGLKMVKYLLGDLGIRKISLPHWAVALILLAGVATALFCGCSAM